MPTTSSSLSHQYARVCKHKEQRDAFAFCIALLCDIIPTELSFKHTIQLWMAYGQQVGSGYIDTELLNELLILVGQQRVGRRPGRVKPRALKRRPKAYSMLNKPKHILKRGIS